MNTKHAFAACLCLLPPLAAATTPGCSSPSKNSDRADAAPFEDEGGAGGGGGEGGSPEQGGQGGETGGTGGMKNGGTPASMGGTGGTAPVVNTATCEPPKLKLTRLTTAASPMAMVQAAGDERMLVAERAGLIRSFRNGAFEAPPFLDMRASVLNEPKTGVHERGLLNLALHPNFADNGRFYVFYTRKNNDPHSQGMEGAVVIAEGKRQGQTNRAETTLTPLTTVDVKEDHHLGGFLAFGPDGLLYAGIGDGGGGRDASGAGQDPKRRLSKILRINVDNPTSKPNGNLNISGADPLTWAYGVRNPFRGSFDSATGDLYFGDVGEASYEEVNFVPPGKTGLNFGWGFDPSITQGGHEAQSGMEGLHPMPWYTAVEWKPFGELPVYEYQHSGQGWSTSATSWQGMGGACTTGIEGACARAVMGGMVYRGKAIPALYGRYFFADHVQNWVMSFIMKAGKVTCYVDLTEDLKTTQTRLQGVNGFAQDASGELYIMDLAAGNIYKIEAE